MAMATRRWSKGSATGHRFADVRDSFLQLVLVRDGPTPREQAPRAINVEALFRTKRQSLLGTHLSGPRLATQLTKMGGKVKRLRHAKGVREPTGPSQRALHSSPRFIRISQHPEGNPSIHPQATPESWP